MNQLDLIRYEKRQEYLRKTWLPTFFLKYSKIFDKKNRIIEKFIRFIRETYFKPVCNLTQTEINDIPPIYRYRLSLTDANLLNEIEDSLITEDQILEYSLMEYEKEYNKNIQKTLNESINQKYNVLIDLRIYGPNPDIPIIINELIFYLDNKQKIDLIKQWNKVNPDTTSGHIYIQKLEFYKSLSKDLYKNN